MTDFVTVASDEVLTKTAEALRNHGFDVKIVDDAAAAKAAALEIIPKGAEVFSATSKTADDIGLSEVVNGEGYVSVRNQMMALYGDESKKHDMKRLASTPDYVVGSVHAITQAGEVFIASATGSQIPAEVYGANHVVLVVGAQKIVADYDEAFKRLREHVLPLEEARAQAVYGVGSAIHKLLIVTQDTPGRTTIILIKRALGF